MELYRDDGSVIYENVFEGEEWMCVSPVDTEKLLFHEVFDPDKYKNVSPPFTCRKVEIIVSKNGTERPRYQVEVITKIPDSQGAKRHVDMYERVWNVPPVYWDAGKRCDEMVRHLTPCWMYSYLEGPIQDKFSRKIAEILVTDSFFTLR